MNQNKVRDSRSEKAPVYTGVDYFRFLFACIIPLLHLSISTPLLLILRNYVARLGVPFFFAVSGVFLSDRMKAKGIKNSLKEYTVRVGRMLLFWLFVYLPLLQHAHSITLQNILFKTPAYLWYLTALLFASLPFCLIKRRYLYPAVIILYCVGTYFSDTYNWVSGGGRVYAQVFLTTRNGLFFALPLMSVGEASWEKRRSPVCLLFSIIMLIAEIHFSLLKTASEADRSMYFFLPTTIYVSVNSGRDPFFRPRRAPKHFAAA